MIRVMGWCVLVIGLLDMDQLIAKSMTQPVDDDPPVYGHTSIFDAFLLMVTNDGVSRK